MFLIVEITASDYYQFNDLLTLEDKAVRMKVKECMEKEVAPIMAEVSSRDAFKMRYDMIFSLYFVFLHSFLSPCINSLVFLCFSP